MSGTTSKRNESKIKSVLTVLLYIIDNRGLSGELPAEIGLLSALENLIIKNEAQLTGRIPDTLANLQALTQLGLYRNSLSGFIPNLFETVVNLRFLNLEGNHLEGSIPSSIEKTTNLETIVLTGNKFEGLVPVESLARTNVKFLDLGHNQFSGNLDPFTSLSNIEHLHLDHNKITGSIPANINSMTRLSKSTVLNRLGDKYVVLAVTNVSVSIFLQKR